MNFYNPSQINYLQAFQMGPMTTSQMTPSIPPSFGPNTTGYIETQPKWLSPEEGLRIGNLDANSNIPYKNYVPRALVPHNDQEALMLRIQQLGFAVHELRLFLNTHPNDRTALELFLKYREELNRLTQEFENRYRPINLGSAPLNKLPWQWAGTDWPWEKE